MKTPGTLAFLSAAMTLAFCQAVPAEEHSFQCRDSSLKGLYAFNASGFNIVAGVAVPKAIVELIRFNGDGTLSVPAATRSVNGVIARSPAGGLGTYAISADCTGSITLGPPGPTFDVFLTPRGTKARLIQITDPSQAGAVLQGIVERVAD
jgi:hypothetical protein